MTLRRDLLGRWKHSARVVVGVSAMYATAALCIAMVQDRDTPTPLAPLPEPDAVPNPEQVELGRLLFFDTRLSGDDTVSCATCHNPQKGWADGLPMSVGYPGSLYFRNTPTILNASSSQYLYWDGRLGGHDLATLVRDHISEAHFMQADGRLVLERMRQVPEYERRFTDAFGGEPTYGRILNAVAAFV
ncbi:MAG: cytochrome-c peroxidase, partial [Planctomycetes bacterium]|nr:cytochrome-c peroxidase [Planctomycetota bacterium]